MTAKRVPDDIIVVRVSTRKSRLARLTQGPGGYSHLNKQPWGLTNVRKYEFVSGPLSIGELHDALAELAEGDPQPYDERRPSNRPRNP